MKIEHKKRKLLSLADYTQKEQNDIVDSPARLDYNTKNILIRISALYVLTILQKDWETLGNEDGNYAKKNKQSNSLEQYDGNIS